MKIRKSPIVIVPEIFMNKLFDTAEERDLEWCLYAKTKQTAVNEFEILDFLTPYQENSGGATEIPETVEIDGKEIDSLYEWRTRGLEGQEPWIRDINEWNCLIHSHNKMGAFWSTTDMEEYTEMAKERKGPFIAIVVNAKKEYKALVCYPSLGFLFDDCQIMIRKEMTLSEYANLPDEEKAPMLEKAKKQSNITERIEIEKYEIRKKLKYDKGYNKEWMGGWTNTEHISDHTDYLYDENYIEAEIGNEESFFDTNKMQYLKKCKEKNPDKLYEKGILKLKLQKTEYHNIKVSLDPGHLFKTEIIQDFNDLFNNPNQYDHTYETGGFYQ